MEEKVTIIYLADSMILSKKEYAKWMEIQDEYPEDYKTNFEPMTCDEIIRFFEEDFKEEENWPFSRECIKDFFESDKVIIKSEE